MTSLSWFLPIAILASAPAPAFAQAWHGQYGGEMAPRAVAVMNAEQWQRLWRGLDRKAPAMDFSKACAVVAYGGERPTGGFTLEFLEPLPQGEDVLIRWRVRAPSPETYTTQAIAHPWMVKVFPRPKGKVKLEQEASLSK